MGLASKLVKMGPREGWSPEADRGDLLAAPLLGAWYGSLRPWYWTGVLLGVRPRVAGPPEEKNLP